MTVRTRFAPSPTGTLHLGSIRTALFNWLYAQHCDGKFIVRVEDTDRERSTDENVAAILDGMAWLGLEADEEIVYQTQRFDRYREVVEAWLASGKAYHCYCTKEELQAMRDRQMSQREIVRYDGRCRDNPEPLDGVDPVVRFKNPLNGEVVVNDLVRGKVVFENSQLDDLIIARSNGTPTYNFTVVVDDYDMKITHVIRGDDHLNNTPRQMNMLAALDAPIPAYAHLPMILGPDGSKLSKRHGAVDIREYRELGYLPEAMLNYLVRLGWSHGDQEIFSVRQMIELFDVAEVNQSASAFNPEKLRWVNQQHILALSPEDLGKRLVPFLEKIGVDPVDGPDPARVAKGFHERAETLLSMAKSAEYCYKDFENPDPKAAKKNLRPVILEPMRAVTQALSDLDDWDKKSIVAVIEKVASDHEVNFGKLGQPIRVAVTGGSVSPPIDVTLSLVGKTRTISRLESALVFIEGRC